MDEAHCATPKSCRECHRTPVSGAASQVSQVRVGHLDAHGPSQNAEIPYPNEINPLFRRISVAVQDQRDFRRHGAVRHCWSRTGPVRGRNENMPRRTTHWAIRDLNWPIRQISGEADLPSIEVAENTETRMLLRAEKLGNGMMAHNFRSPRCHGENRCHRSAGGDVLCVIAVKSQTSEDVNPAEAAARPGTREARDCAGGAGISEGVTTVVPVAIRDGKRIL